MSAHWPPDEELTPSPEEVQKEPSKKPKKRRKKKKKEETEPPKPTDWGPILTIGGVKSNILLIHSKKEAQKKIEKILEVCGGDVTSTGSMAETIQLIAKLGKKPDVIVLPSALSDLGAVEACHLFRSVKLISQVPIMILLDGEDIEMIHDCIDAGANDCLAPSQVAEGLVPRVKKLIKK